MQVKLRGFRVELGEIEHALSEVASVQLAVALVLKDPTGSQRLVAYVTPASIDPATAAADLKARLPAHMVPSVVVPLERMPLLPNEKVDRKALPAPDWGAGAVEEYVAPASELEAQIQAVWQEVLGQQRISTQADFFSVGGNSLQVRSDSPPWPCDTPLSRPCWAQPWQTCTGVPHHVQGSKLLRQLLIILCAARRAR